MLNFQSRICSGSLSSFWKILAQPTEGELGLPSPTPGSSVREPQLQGRWSGLSICHGLVMEYLPSSHRVPRLRVPGLVLGLALPPRSLESQGGGGISPH